MPSFQWSPYRWEPVHYEGSDFRLTFRLRGEVDDMEAILGDRVVPFTLGESTAQLLVPDAEALQIPDRSQVTVRIKTGGAWTTLAQGHLTRRAL